MPYYILIWKGVRQIYGFALSDISTQLTNNWTQLTLTSFGHAEKIQIKVKHLGQQAVKQLLNNSTRWPNHYD